MKKWIKKSRLLQKFVVYVQTHFDDFETTIEENDNSYFELKIYNPHLKDRNITIVFDEFEATFHFSYQHGHFDYEDDGMEKLVDYIKRFIDGEHAAYELFKDGKPARGGGIEFCRIDFSTAESIAQTFSSRMSEDQIEKWAEMTQLGRPDLTKEEIKEIYDESLMPEQERFLEVCKHHEYKICAEGWDGTKDMYKLIFWDGSELSVVDITYEDLPFKRYM